MVTLSLLLAGCGYNAKDGGGECGVNGMRCQPGSKAYHDKYNPSPRTVKNKKAPPVRCERSVIICQDELAGDWPLDSMITFLELDCYPAGLIYALTNGSSYFAISPEAISEDWAPDIAEVVASGADLRPLQAKAATICAAPL